MYIYELVFDSGDEVDHTIITADTEDDAKEQWREHNEGTIVAVDEHGKFRTHDSFEEIRMEVLSRGVPDEYQN